MLVFLLHTYIDLTTVLNTGAEMRESTTVPHESSSRKRHCYLRRVNKEAGCYVSNNKCRSMK